jgi:hypothetical protein
MAKEPENSHNPGIEPLWVEQPTLDPYWLEDDEEDMPDEW